MGSSLVLAGPGEPTFVLCKGSSPGSVILGELMYIPNEVLAGLEELADALSPDLKRALNELTSEKRRAQSATKVDCGLEIVLDEPRAIGRKAVRKIGSRSMVISHPNAGRIRIGISVSYSNKFIVNVNNGSLKATIDGIPISDDDDDDF